MVLGAQAGVILVTTKRGSAGKTEFSYNGQYSVSSISREIPVLSAQEFLANGGTDIGNDTDWIDAITRQGQYSNPQLLSRWRKCKHKLQSISKPKGCGRYT